jgi:hypothetical protein
MRTLERLRRQHVVTCRLTSSSSCVPCRSHANELTQLLGAGDYVCPAGIQLLPRLSQLQHLDLSPGPRSSLLLTPASLQPLSQLHNLQRLRLGNHLARYDTFALAGQLSQLQSLVFEYADDSAASHADVAPLVASRSLQELQLCNAACSDELLAVLSRTRVNKLTLHAGRFCASCKGASALAQQLQSLQLRVNDADLRVFAGALPAFQGLNSLTLSVHRASESCTELMQVRTAVDGNVCRNPPALQQDSKQRPDACMFVWGSCAGVVSVRCTCSYQHHAQCKSLHQHWKRAL